MAGKCEGSAKLVWVDGRVYEGDWTDDKFHGTGKYTYVNGDVYEGAFENGKRHGHGKVICADGAEYEGDWANDEKHGPGKYTCGNGDVYEGRWVNGKRHDTFTMKCASGEAFKQQYNHGALVSSKRQGTISLGENPSQRLHVDRDATVAVLHEDHTTCSICLEAFSFDMNSNDVDVKRHLPVLGTCLHYCCHGCVLDQQTYQAGRNNGRVPRTVNCICGCRKRFAFHPAHPKYHTLLIELLERSISGSRG